MRIFGIQSDGKFVEFAPEPFQAGHTRRRSMIGLPPILKAYLKTMTF